MGFKLNDNLLYKNANGNTYCILGQKGDKALLKCLVTGEIIVASGFDIEYSSWGSGSYYGCDLLSAVNKFYK